MLSYLTYIKIKKNIIVVRTMFLLGLFLGFVLCLLITEDDDDDLYE